MEGETSKDITKIKETPSEKVTETTHETPGTPPVKESTKTVEKKEK